MRALLLATLVAGSHGGAIELTPDNFDAEVLNSGKNAFIKFLAPWDRLADDYKDSSTVLIGDVDCTASGKPLCDKYGVKGYPTIKTFSSSDSEGTDYDGGRTFDDLKKHAETLGPSCSIEHKDLCSAEDLKLLEKYAAMSQARRDAKIIKLKNAIAKEEARHEGVQKELQAKFEASQQKLEKMQTELKPQIKMMRAATPSAA